MSTTLTPKNLAQLRRSRWTASTARWVLATQAASGERLTGFARRHGLRPQRLFWWRDRLAEWTGEGSTAPQLVPAVTVESSRMTSVPGSPAPQVRVQVREVAVEISDAAAVPPGWLAELLRELRR